MASSPAPEFDPRLLEEYAEQLYRRADAVRVGSIAAGGVIGLLFGAVPLSPLGKYLPVSTTMGPAFVLLGVLCGALIGYVIGQGRAFRIRFQAQLVLFQLQIERNTRQAALHASSPMPVPASAPAPAAPALAQPFLPVQSVVHRRPVVPAGLQAPAQPAAPRMAAPRPVVPVAAVEPAYAAAAAAAVASPAPIFPAAPSEPEPEPAPRPLQAVPEPEPFDPPLLPPLSP